MKHLLHILVFVSLALPIASTAVGAPPSSSKPNLVVIFIDDLGYGDIGPFGSTLNRTPHLDRMAAEGMKLTSFYAAPVCSVSRAQLLTGCYGARISVPGVYFPAGPNGLNPQEETIAELVKPQGYATMCVGKWHVGDQPEFLPTNQGFDHYFGIPYSNDMQRKSLDTDQRVVPLLRDNQVAELLTDEAQTTVTERYTDEAVAFVRAHRDRPFFLYFPHTAVHTPIVPGAAFQGKSANGRFGDWVEEVDASVGRVLDALRELKLEQNTLVLFTSDNGPWLIKGSDGGVAGPLRGGKGSTWEGGVRVPTIAWWPGRIPAGTTCDTVAATIDLLPTLVNLAGGVLPTGRVIDGRDITPLLLAESTEAPREAHYYFAGYTLQAVRQGPWKLALTPQSETMGKGVAADAAGPGPRLYNLDDEIGERTNLAAQHPDIVQRLQDLAAQMNAELGGPAPSGRRPAGSVENPVTLYPAENPSRGGKPASPAKPVPIETLQVGDALPASQAPQVAGKSVTIQCVTEPDPAGGVIVSHGGSAMGYTLYLKDNRAVFAVRHAKQVTRITSAELPAGELKLAAQLSADGVLTLSVNDQPTEAVKAPGPLAGQPFEEFNVGFDGQNTVDEYDGSKRFQGTIRGLSITVQP
jgi:arylsulfatase A-like enzyme